MKIIKVPVSQLNPAPYNPRLDLKPGDADYEKLKRSIGEFGYVEILVWNKRTGNLVSGHQRLKILIEQGVTDVDVSVVDLSLPKEKQLNLILNRVRGDWDEDKLEALLSELSNIPDFDLASTGFDLPELSEILDSGGESAEDDYDFEADVNANEAPITKPGDLFELGDNRLFCGDATKPEDLATLLGKEKVGLLDIDWPYNVNYMGGSCPRVDTRPKKTRKWERIYSDNMPQEEYEAFMRKVLANIKTYLRPGAAFYQWQAHRQLGPLYQILAEMDFHIACLVCWAKESVAISYADYSFQTEQAVYGWLKGESHYFAGQPGESNLWQVKRDSTKTYCHPCQKPVELAERAIKNSSKRGEVVLDVFLGSGSVLIGAEALGRRCFGMEMDPKYCDAIIRRYIRFAPGRVSKDLEERFVKGVAHEK